MKAFVPGARVTVTLDGESVPAREGEPVVAALVRAGKIALARSPKFHRPRGPTCLRAACDGCLARVDDEPNVMTCRAPARDGMRIETQNTLGSRRVDLLRVSDWFFPEGMNHHELFAGVPGAQPLMQSFARRVAGLGRLPKDARPPRKATRRSVDVLVIGAGPAGMAVADALANAGRAVEIVDDALFAGGGARALGPKEGREFEPIFSAFSKALDGGVALRCATTAGAVYGRDVLVAGEDGVSVIEPRDLVLATGAHDGALAFEGNDVPGVMSARAAGWLLAMGTPVGARVVVVVSPGGGPFGASFARAAKDAGVDVVLVRGEPVRVRGTSRVKGVVVRASSSGSRKDETHAADAVVVDAPRAPAYELAAQAGAELVHEARGFRVRAPRIGDGVWAVGELVGTAFDADAIVREARALARMIAAEAATRSADQSSINGPKSAIPPSKDTVSNTPRSTK